METRAKNSAGENGASTQNQNDQMLTTLSQDTDYENPIGSPGFAGDAPQINVESFKYPSDSGYDEYLEAGNEI